VSIALTVEFAADTQTRLPHTGAKRYPSKVGVARRRVGRRGAKVTAG
jgi:hypothetical protein